MTATSEAGRGHEPSLSHLLGRLDLVSSRVRQAVARRRSSDPRGDDDFRGLYISEADVDRLLGDPPLPVPPTAEAATLLISVERAADKAEQTGADLRLRRLGRNFGLDQLDLELLLIAVAPDLDPRFEKLFGYLHDDVSRRRASIGLALELCGCPAALAEARRKLSAAGPLVSQKLVLVEDEDRPFLTRALRVADRVAAFLLGDDTPDPAVAVLTLPCRPQQSPSIPGLSRAFGDGARLAYIGDRGAGAARLVAASFQAVGMASLAIDLERLRPDDDVAATAALVTREARLLDAGIIAGPIDVLVSRGAAAVQAFAEGPVACALIGSRGWDPAWSRRVPFIARAPALDTDQRGEIWQTALRASMPAGLDPVAATRGFRLSADQVERAAAAARLQAQASERSLAAADLRAGARAQNAGGLERLATRIEPAVSMADLVLPGEVLDDLRDLMVRARQRETVLDEWRMGGPASRRRGLAALFAGPSGTGKTMAAEVVAGELGLDLYAVDLATVVDKYIGETEKNLDRIFVEAERINGVLLFDEADAIFGKRSEVSDAHDRYANVEIAYLLQRMEAFEGIAILATNLRSNLDEAFARRLDLVVEFPEPDEPHRRALWERCLGPIVPRAADLDFAFLAGAFKLSGGNIRNISVAAAYMAAEERRPVAMADLVRATQREYRKLGRLTVAAEFGRYYAMINQ